MDAVKRFIDFFSPACSGTNNKNTVERLLLMTTVDYFPFSFVLLHGFGYLSCFFFFCCLAHPSKALCENKFTTIWRNCNPQINPSIIQIIILYATYIQWKNDCDYFFGIVAALGNKQKALQMNIAVYTKTKIPIYGLCIEIGLLRIVF